MYKTWDFVTKPEYHHPPDEQNSEFINSLKDADEFEKWMNPAVWDALS